MFYAWFDLFKHISWGRFVKCYIFSKIATVIIASFLFQAMVGIFQLATILKENNIVFEPWIEDAMYEFFVLGYFAVMVVCIAMLYKFFYIRPLIPGDGNVTDRIRWNISRVVGWYHTLTLKKLATFGVIVLLALFLYFVIGVRF